MEDHRRRPDGYAPTMAVADPATDATRMASSAVPVEVAVSPSARTELATGTSRTPGPGERTGPVIGGMIGRYTVTTRIGMDPIGVVFGARDDGGRAIAVKLVHATVAHPAYRTRLVRDAQALLGLAHPSLVPIREIGVAFGRPFVAMDFVDGVLLPAWLQTPRSWAVVCDVFAQIGGALATGHRAGFIHGDWTGECVLVEANGRPRVIDVGIGRFDPRGSGAVDPRADQLRFAVALRAALGGGAEGDPARWESVPAKVRAVVARAVDDASPERYPSMVELVVALDRARGKTGNSLAGLASGMRAAEAPPARANAKGATTLNTRGEGVGEGGGKRWLLFVGVGVAFAVAAGVGAYAVVSARDRSAGVAPAGTGTTAAPIPVPTAAPTPLTLTPAPLTPAPLTPAPTTTAPLTPAPTAPAPLTPAPLTTPATSPMPSPSKSTTTSTPTSAAPTVAVAPVAPPPVAPPVVAPAPVAAGNDQARAIRAAISHLGYEQSDPPDPQGAVTAALQDQVNQPGLPAIVIGTDYVRLGEHLRLRGDCTGAASAWRGALTTLASEPAQVTADWTARAQLGLGMCALAGGNYHGAVAMLVQANQNLSNAGARRDAMLAEALAHWQVNEIDSARSAFALAFKGATPGDPVYQAYAAAQDALVLPAR